MKNNNHLSEKKNVKHVRIFVVSLVSILAFLLMTFLPKKNFLANLYIPFMEESPTLTVFVSATPTPTLFPTPTSTITQAPTPSISPTPMPPEGKAFSVGSSIEGKSIDVFRFGSGSNVRMIIGGIHGGYEWNTSVLSYLLIEDIKSGRIKVPFDTTLYILPILNPDGYFDYPDSSYGRGNARSVDLNRNWDAIWEADWPRTGCFSYVYITAGEKPFSEPETQALSQFILDNQVKALISYHSAMSSIFAGGRPEPDTASENLAKALASVSGYNYPPLDGGACCYTGQLIDWASANGIAAVDIELTDHDSNDIVINRKVLEAFLAWQE